MGRSGCWLLQRADISVIIPTRNRAAWLPTCLAHLEQQTFPAGRFEVLVVDDGSTDDTASVIDRYASGAPVRIRRHTQPHQGLAAARNAGAREAVGDVLLFLSDDELVSPQLLEQHHAARQVEGEDVCIMGDIRRHPQLPHDTFTRLFLESQAPWAPGDSPSHFLNWHRSNFSLSRKVFQSVGGLNEAPEFATVVTLELAYRLDKARVRPVYIIDARVYVWQPTTFATERLRQYHLGYGLKHLQHVTRAAIIPQKFRLKQSRFKNFTRTITIPYYVRACNRHEAEASMLISSLYRRVLFHDRLTGYQDACQNRGLRPPVVDDSHFDQPLTRNS